MGWNNAEHDQLYDRWLQALDLEESDRLLVQIARLQMEELPYIPTYFDPAVAAQASALVGPYLGFGYAWANVHEWYWRQ